MKKFLLALLFLIASPLIVHADGSANNAGWVGSYTIADTVYFDFTTYTQSTGVPATLSASTGSPTIVLYKVDSATPVTGASITLSPDFNSVTGLNHVKVDTTGYTAGQYVAVIGPNATVTDSMGTSLAGYQVATFAVSVPQSSDLRAVNGGSTGTTAGRLELTDGLYITGTAGTNPALKLTGGAATAGAQAGPGLLVVGGAASAAQLSSPGAAIYGGAGTATKAAGVGMIVGAGVKDAMGDPAPGMLVVSSQPSVYGGHAVFDSTGDIPGAIIVGRGAGNGVSIADGSFPFDTGYANGGTGWFIGSAGGPGLDVEVTAGNTAVNFTSPGGGSKGLAINGGLAVAGADDDAVRLTPVGTGKAINALGQVYVAPSNTDDDAIKLVPNGVGHGISGTLTLTKNTAFAKFPFVMFNTSGAPVSGKTVVCQRSLDGAAFGDCANSPMGIGAGAYYVDLADTDLDGNSVVLKFTVTGDATVKPTIIPIITQP